MSARFHWNGWLVRSEPLYALPADPAVEVIAIKVVRTFGGKQKKRRVSLKGGNRLTAKNTAAAMDETVARMLAVLAEKDRPEPATRRIK